MSWIVRMIVVLPALAALRGTARAAPARARRRPSPSSVSAYVAVLGLIQWIAPSRTADIETHRQPPAR